MDHWFKFFTERRLKRGNKISLLKFNMQLYFSYNVRLVSIQDFDKWSAKAKKIT